MRPYHNKEEIEEINNKFLLDLDYYYTLKGKEADNFLKSNLWLPIYECAFNTVWKSYKKLYGKAYFDEEKMHDWAVDITMVLIGRIKEKTRNVFRYNSSKTEEENKARRAFLQRYNDTKGYLIESLPTAVYYARLLVAYRHQLEEEKDEQIADWRIDEYRDQFDE